MSDTFVVAARIPMGREAFEQWLTTPAPGTAAIENPGAMYDRWFWDGKTPDWRQAESGVTPREYFADCFGEDAGGLTYVLRYRAGALEAYLMHFGFCESNIYTALVMLATAGRLSSSAAPSTVLFWAETSGSMFAADSNGWLATLSVGIDGARFAADIDLTATIAQLRPAEASYFDLLTRLAEVQEAAGGEGESSFAAIARDPRFVDAAVLARS
ncbi:hypothetical protein [Nocardia brasiliensis]|uniref:hypothetical protein n=1 Tax=Nocardia brasiliensis TaxID=37326 RepID=UPI00245663FE|nr:hypothetical protein [Nocardia brasiliensis]